MIQLIWSDLKEALREKNMVTRLIILNCLVFVFINSIKIILNTSYSNEPWIFNDFLRFFSMSSVDSYLLTHPWGILTSAFLHQGFTHLLWTMLTFYWFGRIVRDITDNRFILPIYICATIAGNIIFFLVANFTDYGLTMGSMAHGAGAATMAMMVISLYYAPNHVFNVLFIGPVRLKYIVLFIMLADILNVMSNVRPMSSLINYGGAIVAICFILYLQKNRNKKP
jgi:membrane associated rhomboid family serine protease